jgi:hypothetical protein
VKRIEIDPDTGEVWISLFGLPPAVTQPQMWKRTPAEARVPIGLGAGACFAAFDKLLGGTEVVTFLYYPGTCNRPPRLEVVT